MDQLLYAHIHSSNNPLWSVRVKKRRKQIEITLESNASELVSIGYESIIG